MSLKFLLLRFFKSKSHGLEEIRTCSKWDTNDLNRNSPDYYDEYNSSPNSQTPTQRDGNRINENKFGNNQEYEDERRKLLREIEVFFNCLS